MNVCSHVQSRKLVHMCCVHCHVHAPSTSGCAFVYFTVQYCIEYSSTVSLFQARSARGLHWTPCCSTQGAYKWRPDGTGGPEKGRRETRGRRSNRRTVEIHDTRNGKGIFFLWGGTVSFWGTGPKQNGTQRLQQPFRMQSSATVSSMMRKSRAATHTSWDHFFKRVDRIKSSKEPDLCHQCQAWVKL